MTVTPASGKKAAWGLLLLRLPSGWVFLSEGVQKFLFPAALGARSLSLDERLSMGKRWPRA